MNGILIYKCNAIKIKERATIHEMKNENYSVPGNITHCYIKPLYLISKKNCPRFTCGKGFGLDLPFVNSVMHLKLTLCETPKTHHNSG